MEEYPMFTKAMRGEFLAGALSAADYAFYPLVAFMNRCETKLPDLDANGMLTPELRAWKARIEALPYLDKTIPPHWKQK
jgi:glutathione S-transferase